MNPMWLMSVVASDALEPEYEAVFTSVAAAAKALNVPEDEFFVEDDGHFVYTGDESRAFAVYFLDPIAVDPDTITL